MERTSKIGTLPLCSGYITGKKRKHEDTDEEEVKKIIDLALHTPKRKKLESTVQYIYQALFEEGKNSDVTVCALGEEFYLHKVYLSQSPYFASMFGGSWVETTKKYVNIDIVDPLITVNSLRIVFGSLYNCEIILSPIGIVSTLATATMFQLDGLIEKCTEVMLETINSQTSLAYYKAACNYGDRKLEQVCFKWFLVNLMTYYFTPPFNHLKVIPTDLMEKLIAHPDLFVMQTEYSIYVMLKCWMYMQLNENIEEVHCSKVVCNYFASRKGELPFLLSREGKRFSPVFRGLRLHNLLSQKMDIEVITKDNIVPECWVHPVVLQQWRNVLRVDQNEDLGPQDVCKEHFLKTSLRCGRILQVNERHVWRWTGFHFGIDLIMISDQATLYIKRNTRAEYEYGQLLSMQNIRNISIRVTVVKLNEQRQIIYSKESEILTVGLTKGGEISILTFDSALQYPIIISANIMYTSPDKPEVVAEDLVKMVP